MRIAAVADLHIGSGTMLAPGRLEHQQRMWESICKQMNEAGADVVVIAGDVFHRRRPTPDEYQAYQRGLEVLSCPVVSIDGNHDVTSAAAASALEVGDPVSVHRRTPGMLYDGAAATIVGMPWTPPHTFRASMAELDAANGDKPVGLLLTDVARQLRALSHGDSAAVLVLHWSVSGADTPNGMSVDAFREPVIPGGELAAQRWDWVICGHIHLRQLLAGTPNMLYVGSPWVVDWGEVEEEHGWTLIDTEQNTAVQYENEWDWPFAEVVFDVDANGWLSVPDQGSDPEGAVVRAVVRAPQGVAVPTDQVHAYLGAVRARHVYKIVVERDRAERRRLPVGVSVEDLSPGEALELWMAGRDVPVESLREKHAQIAAR